jgi:hypothetical protein
MAPTKNQNMVALHRLVFVEVTDPALLGLGLGLGLALALALDLDLDLVLVLVLARQPQQPKLQQEQVITQVPKLQKPQRLLTLGSFWKKGWRLRSLWKGGCGARVF